MKKKHVIGGVGLCLAFGLMLGAVPAGATTYTAVDVRILATGSTEHESTVYVSSDGCTVQDSTGTEHVITGDAALCALNQVAQQTQQELELMYYDGFGLLLNAYAGHTADMSNYWLYYVNYQSPAVGLAEYDLEDGDELLLTYGGFELPLRLALDKTHRRTNGSITATVDYYMTDWMTGEGSYMPMQGATVYVGDQMVTTDELGQAQLLLDTAGTYTVYADAEGFVPTVQQTVYAYRQHQTLQHVGKKKRKKLVNQGTEYLLSFMDDYGLVEGSQSLTEWSAMAFAAAKKKNKKLFNAVRSYTPTAESGTTELARHIMALEAIGEDARDHQGVNYVKRLKNTMENDQFGSELYCNDDIFAVLALVAADEPLSSSAVQQSVTYSLECQNQDGGVSYAVDGASDMDTTAAWLQMAAQLKGKKKQHGIALKAPRFAAVQYIRVNQNPDGGWGYVEGAASNTSTTAWVLQALRARGHQAKAMTTNNRNGFHFLQSAQRTASGAFQYDVQNTNSVETLNTAYSILALKAHPFPVNKKRKLIKNKK